MIPRACVERERQALLNSCTVVKETESGRTGQTGSLCIHRLAVAADSRTRAAAIPSIELSRKLAKYRQPQAREAWDSQTV